MESNERFHDNPSGAISDTKYGKEWLPKDSYQDLGKWSNLDEANAYAKLMNQVYAGGHSDWRLPTKDEAVNFWTPELTQLDLEGEEVNIHKLFVTKCAFYIWTNEVNDKDQALRVNLRDGSTEYIDKKTREPMAARLVRDAK